MRKKSTCKCGSPRVVYVVQKGRGKALEAFCEKCLPVETVETKNTLFESEERQKKP